MGEMNNPNSIKKDVLEALIKCRGIVSDACAMAGIGRTTFYDWLEQDPEFAKGVELAKEAAIDYVEGYLYKNIEKGLEASTIFYLKTRGRARGYAEKIDINHDGLDNININIKFSNG